MVYASQHCKYEIYLDEECEKKARRSKLKRKRKEKEKVIILKRPAQAKEHNSQRLVYLDPH
jgi:hypothetical protein